MPRSGTSRIFTPELLVLTASAAATRFWGLFTPNAVVFDELHFEHHAGHYLAGTHYFDVHPPLGKLLYAAVARLAGVPATVLLDGQPAVVLRVLPALFGTLIVPLIYILLRQLGSARQVAALGALLALCDNALLVDSRFILLEPLLIGFGLSAIVLFLASRARRGFARLAFLAAAAFAAGCALSVKWTGASALGLIGAAWLIDTMRGRVPHKRAAAEGALLLLVPSMIYVSAFAVHFALLTKGGVDDTAMSVAFRRTLVGDPLYRAGDAVSFLAKLTDVHHAIGVGNRSLEGVTHPSASAWYTWPIMKHPIGLWEDASPPTRSIILVGNPVVWWGAWIGVLVSLVVVTRRGDNSRLRRFGLAFVAAAYLFNMLPFVAITRVMYLYHYLFAELWLAVLATLMMSLAAGWNEPEGDILWRFPSTRSATTYWAIAALALAGFSYFAPLTYGLPLSTAAYDARFWVLHPRL